MLPSGSMTHANFPYSDSSTFSRTLQPSSFSALTRAMQVFDAIVDHEGRGARREVVALGGADRPDGRACGRLALSVGPRERGASPLLHVDAEVSLVPGSQCDGVAGLEEYAADACDAPHVSPPW